MELLNRFYAGWRDLMDNKSDQRVKNWPLMSSPLPSLIICLTYVFIVKVVGPKFMENRKPYKLRKIIVAYNFFQVIFSTYLFLEAGHTGWFGDYNWRCQAVDFSMNAMALRTARGSWWYFFSKYTEFFDTFFFILRKRYDQVSTLHVIHHGIMPFSVWWGVKFMAGGHSTFFGFLNTFVHIVMYTYYMMAAIGPEMQKYLWWKKYLTIFQMVQFIGIFTHAVQLFFHNPCNYPIVFAYWLSGHAVLFLVLFYGFYKQAYNKKQMMKKKVEDINGNITSKTNSSANENCVIANGVKEIYKFNGLDDNSLRNRIITTGTSH